MESAIKLYKSHRRVPETEFFCVSNIALISVVWAL